MYHIRCKEICIFTEIIRICFANLIFLLSLHTKVNIKWCMVFFFRKHIMNNYVFISQKLWWNLVDVSMNKMKVLAWEENVHTRKIREAIKIPQHLPTLNRDCGQEIPITTIHVLAECSHHHGVTAMWYGQNIMSVSPKFLREYYIINNVNMVQFM